MTAWIVGVNQYIASLVSQVTAWRALVTQVRQDCVNQVPYNTIITYIDQNEPPG